MKISERFTFMTSRYVQIDKKLSTGFQRMLLFQKKVGFLKILRILFHTCHTSDLVEMFIFQTFVNINFA